MPFVLLQAREVPAADRHQASVPQSPATCSAPHSLPRSKSGSRPHSNPESSPGPASLAPPATPAVSVHQESVAASAHREAAAPHSAAVQAVPASCTLKPPPIRSCSPREIPHTIQPDYRNQGPIHLSDYQRTT